MSTNTVTAENIVATETERVTRGRKPGTTNVPNSAVLAYLTRTDATIQAMLDAGIDPAGLVAMLAPTVKSSQEFKDSPECKNVAVYKVAESVAKWDAQTRENYMWALLGTADPAELRSWSAMLETATDSARDNIAEFISADATV